MPFLWQVELDTFIAYEASVGQELTEEGLRLWMERVQARQCVVAGHGCDKPKRGRFCEHHAPKAEPEPKGHFEKLRDR